jgi:hypothetical protein
MSKHKKTSGTNQLKYREVETKVRAFLPPTFYIYEVWLGNKKIGDWITTIDILLSIEKQQKMLTRFFGGDVKWNG